MKSSLKVLIPVACLTFSCATSSSETYPVSKESIKPGTTVKLRNENVSLYSGGFKEGDDMNALLKDMGVDTKGHIAVINVVPSVDTPVCEEQTHVLGESAKLNPSVKRVTISRDLPMAQSRFAKEAKLTNISYGSDYKDGSFGKKTGLMMHGSELLARAVIVTDKAGKVAYYQVVPDIATLPDMAKAFDVANGLAEKM